MARCLIEHCLTMMLVCHHDLGIYSTWLVIFVTSHQPATLSSDRVDMSGVMYVRVSSVWSSHPSASCLRSYPGGQERVSLLRVGSHNLHACVRLHACVLQCSGSAKLKCAKRVESLVWCSQCASDVGG